jgi:hypothetical protein
MIDFEFGHAISLSNLKKHGIDFGKAKIIWDDPDYIEVPPRVQDEPRFLVAGQIEGELWSAVVTYRHNKIRIISVRRARPEEEAIYES